MGGASILLWSCSLASALHVGPRTVPHRRRTTQVARRLLGVCCKEPSDTPALDTADASLAVPLLKPESADASPAVPVMKTESLTSHHAVGDDHPHGIVLIIYTGGTMGMTKDPSNGALSPDKSYLRQCISEMPEFSNSDMPDTDIIQYEPLLDSSNIGTHPGYNPMC